MKAILNILFSTIFFILFGIVLFTILTTRFGVFNIHSYIVQTGSMEPQIHVGSVVFTRPDIYQFGDIVTFNRGSITVTHRLVGTRGSQFITKGDANKVADNELVNRQDIIGKDIIIIPYIGKFVNYLKTIPGFALFIALPILIYVSFEVRTFKQEWEKEIEKRLRHKLTVEETL